MGTSPAQRHCCHGYAEMLGCKSDSFYFRYEGVQFNIIPGMKRRTSTDFLEYTSHRKEFISTYPLMSAKFDANHVYMR